MRNVSQRAVECVIAGVPALAIFVWWTLQGGGYFEREWMPGAVLMLVIAASSAIALRREIAPRSGAAAAAIAAFTAYVLWSFASILWADTPGDAMEGSQRTLMYLVWFAVFALLPWTTGTLLAGVVAFIATMTLIGAATLIRLAGDAPLAELFIDGSLLGPVGYHNASVALFTMAAVPAVMLAARPELGRWMRPPLLAAAMLLLGLAALGQSRGWLFTLPVVASAALLLSPDRLKLALFAAPVLGGLAFAAPAAIAVGRAGGGLAAVAAEPALRPALDVAVTKLALASAGTFVAAIALLAAEQRVQARGALGARARRTLSIALAGAVLLGATTSALVATDGRPIDRIGDAWADFTAVKPDDGGIASLGGARYDFWRIALDAWVEHPVLGVGQDNFIELYAARGRSREEPRWVHSMPLRLLTHTGLVGAALFAAFLVALVRAATGAWRLADGHGGRAVTGAALVPGVVWLAHGSVDWFWEVPALSVAALAFAGAVVALGPPDAAADDSATGPPDAAADDSATGGPDAADRDAGRSRRAQRTITSAAIATVLAGSAILVPSFIADRDVAVAEQTWRDDPSGAYARLNRAGRLNPLSADPWLAEGRIAQQRGDLRRARTGFAEAARRSPRAWYPRFALGLVASAAHDPGAARRELRAARSRNPRDPLVADALRRVGGSAPLAFAEAQRRLDARLRIKRTQRG